MFYFLIVFYNKYINFVYNVKVVCFKYVMDNFIGLISYSDRWRYKVYEKEWFFGCYDEEKV